MLVIARSYALTGRYAAAAGTFDRIIERTGYEDSAVEGELVIASANEWAIRRTDERAGTVVVHFPHLGYQLKKI